jgi:site-specific recombinase XerD
MVQKNGNWQWLLEGFKFDPETQVRPRTVEYCYDLARIFVKWVESSGISSPELLSRRDINGFFHYITQESPTARKSNNSGEWAHRAESLRFHYYRGIKRFCGWMESERHIEQDPLSGIVFRSPKDAPIEPYNQDHIEKLFAVLDFDWKVAKTQRQKMLAARDKAIISLFFESGLRLGELTALSLRDVDLNEQRIAVWYGKQGKSRVTGFGPQTKNVVNPKVTHLPWRALTGSRGSRAEEECVRWQSATVGLL